ncbi:hypothetical protein RMCBS344292_01044 [Rhizopus microsporus]|nr:hypothetical protein RMCBS344292_01044 [Rhizopus microsporus]
MFACQKRLLVSRFQQVSRIHISSVQLAGSESGLFGKLNPWAKKQNKESVTPAQPTAEEPVVTFDVKYETKEEFVSWKRKEVLKDEKEIEGIVRSAVLEHVADANDQSWNQVALTDLDTKFKILKESMKQTGKEVPNYKLNEIETTQDVVAALLDNTKQEESKTIKDILTEKQEELPSNITFILDSK